MENIGGASAAQARLGLFYSRAICDVTSPGLTAWAACVHSFLPVEPSRASSSG